jgi:hypothetical protein
MSSNPPPYGCDGFKRNPLDNPIEPTSRSKSRAAFVAQARCRPVAVPGLTRRAGRETDQRGASETNDSRPADHE